MRIRVAWTFPLWMADWWSPCFPESVPRYLSRHCRSLLQNPLRFPWSFRENIRKRNLSPDILLRILLTAVHRRSRSWWSPVFLYGILALSVPEMWSCRDVRPLSWLLPGNQKSSLLYVFSTGSAPGWSHRPGSDCHQPVFSGNDIPFPKLPEILLRFPWTPVLPGTERTLLFLPDS